MRALVTGSAGKVGSRVMARLREEGHRAIGTDIRPPAYGPSSYGEPPYVRADLTDYGQATGVVQRARPEAIVHTAGIPEPSHDTAATIFATNTLSTFNIAEAAARGGVARLVYTSSETAPGFVTAERPWLPCRVPVDEGHPVLPQDAYGLSKAVGEDIVAALVRRTDITAVSVRPALVLAPDDYAAFGALVRRDPRAGAFNQWSYVDADDLADLIVLAVTGGTEGHEIVYAAQPDNIAGRPLAELMAEVYGDRAPETGPLDRPDAGGICSDKARRLFGWEPRRSWRDHVPPQAGGTVTVTGK